MKLILGALTPTIGSQLKTQGLTANRKQLTAWQTDSMDIVRLTARGLLTRDECVRAEKRLCAAIAKGVRCV